MRNESGGIFIDQNQATELQRLTGLAAFVKLRMGFEDAEQFVFVGNVFALQDTSTRRAANMLGALDKDLDFSNSGNRCEIQFVLVFQGLARFLGTRENSLGASQQLAILVSKSFFVLGSLACSNATDLASCLFDLLQLVIMLTPSHDLIVLGKRGTKLDGFADAIDDQ